MTEKKPLSEEEFIADLGKKLCEDNFNDDEVILFYLYLKLKKRNFYVEIGFGIAFVIVFIAALVFYSKLSLYEEFQTPLNGHYRVSTAKNKLMEKHRKKPCGGSLDPNSCFVKHTDLFKWLNEWEQCQQGNPCDLVASAKAEAFVYGAIDYGMELKRAEFHSICIPPGRKKVEVLTIVHSFLKKDAEKKKDREPLPAILPILISLSRDYSKWRACWGPEERRAIDEELEKIEW